MQDRFVREYLANGGQIIEAARAAGYKNPHVAGTEARRDPRVMAAIRTLMADYGVSADRIRIALADIAFNNDLANLWDDIQAGRSLREMRDGGAKTSMIRKITVRETQNGTTTTVETYSRLDALMGLAKVMGMVDQQAGDEDPKETTINVTIEQHILGALESAGSRGLHPQLPHLGRVVDVEQIGDKPGSCDDEEGRP